jgi:hypothetical protein
MNKTILSILFTLLVGISFSQYLCFEEVNPIQPQTDQLPLILNDDGVYPNQTLISDLNLDGYPDLLFVGNITYPSSSNAGTKIYIYLNDGNGNYSFNANNPFLNLGIGQGAAALGDVDGDSDDDILILSSLSNMSGLYKNDGTGQFTQASNSGFESVNIFNFTHVSAPIFGDMDGDSDLDIIVGNHYYWNDGTGNFTTNVFMILNTMSATDLPEIAYVEVNGDGNMDVIASGIDTGSNVVTKLYTGYSGGMISANPTNPFISVSNGSIAHSDIDNDGDQDILITGIDPIIHASRTTLYKNDGSGNFTIVNSTPFFPSSYGKVLFTDINNDGFEDVFLTGGDFSDTSSVTAPTCFSNYYINDGAGNFTLVNGTPFEGTYGTAAVGDIDGDNLKETFIIGQRIFNNLQMILVSKMYTVDLCTTPPNGIFVNTYTTPSTVNGCNGILYISAQGIPDYTFDLQNGSPIIYSMTGAETVPGLCPGIYSLLSTGGNGDTLTSTFVIASDSSSIFNNPFSPGTTTVDELSFTVENCDIDYATISDAYIDSVVLILPDTLLVEWAIVDANDTTIVPATYVLSSGSGNYYIQLDLFCSQKSIDKYFVVTEGLGFNNGVISLLEVKQNDDLSIALMPNPTSGIVTIQLNDSEPAQLNILDLQGKIILSREIKNNEQVTLDTLSTGTYLFDIRSKSGKSVTRVVKY